ncbi:MAG TPA: hypothetical protein VF062_23620, partial [Candidatus Limnocylindrales bacterium]
MEMDRQWHTTRRTGFIRASDGQLYRVNGNAAALAYEAISMLMYRTVILPARYNINEWHRAANLLLQWRSSRRLVLQRHLRSGLC